MITPLIDKPTVVQTTFTNVLQQALECPTLEAALTYACICESERAIDQARNRFGSGSNGAGWDTCFGIVIKGVMEAYLSKHNLTIISIKPQDV